MNYTVIGNPIGHSLSPLMHQANFKALHLDSYFYDKTLLEDVSSIRSLVEQKDLAGFNVTLPFKEKIVPFLDEVRLPKEINAVNTVKVEEDGKLIGYNTDIYGILTDFSEKDIVLKDKHVMILGYGGLGKTLASVLKAIGFHPIVANRSNKPGVDIVGDAQEVLYMIEDADVVINTMKIGTLDDPGLKLEVIRDFHGYFYDCTPGQSTIARRIQEETAGKAFNGIGMLVHQGAKAFEIWTGMQADVDAMKESMKVQF